VLSTPSERSECGMRPTSSEILLPSPLAGEGKGVRRRGLDDRCSICRSTHVIPFRVHFRPGVSLYEQIVYAAKKAIISGQLRPGDAFPSVRTLSKELKINPNTAHKVVVHLVSAGLLETQPGVGTLVAALPASSAAERTQLLGIEIEQLVVEAKKLGIGLEDMVASISAHWRRLGGADGPMADSGRGGRGRR
jgi:GntR family transcriptional regulator